MTHYLYSRRGIISIMFGLTMALLLFFMFPPMPSVFFLIFPLIFFISNFVMMYGLITHQTSKHMTESVVYEYHKMKLESPIMIHEKRGIKIAKFTLSNEKYVVNFEIESKFGNPGWDYKEINIDNIMIKKDKEYSVEITKKILSINNKICQTLLIPTKIDYFNLEERFYIYKIM